MCLKPTLSAGFFAINKSLFIVTHSHFNVSANTAIIQIAIHQIVLYIGIAADNNIFICFLCFLKVLFSSTFLIYG